MKNTIFSLNACSMIAAFVLSGCVTNTGRLQREGPDALLRSAQTLVNNGQRELAGRRLSAAENLAIQRGDQKTLGDVYLLRSSLAKQGESFDRALDYLLKAITAFQSARDNLGEAAARSETIQIYGSKGEYDEALKQLQLARKAYLIGRSQSPERDIPMYNPKFRSFSGMLDSFEEQLATRIKSIR